MKPGEVPAVWQHLCSWPWVPAGRPSGVLRPGHRPLPPALTPGSWAHGSCHHVTGREQTPRSQAEPRQCLPRPGPALGWGQVKITRLTPHPRAYSPANMWADVGAVPQGASAPGNWNSYFSSQASLLDQQPGLGMGLDGRPADSQCLSCLYLRLPGMGAQGSWVLQGHGWARRARVSVRSTAGCPVPGATQPIVRALPPH